MLSFADAETRVFWDLEDFPVPKDRDLFSFRKQARRAVENEGYVGYELSFYGYVGTKTEEEKGQLGMARITIAHKSVEKRSRLNKMLLDMLAWSFQNYIREQANFLVVAKDIPEENTEFFPVLQALTKRGHHVFLAVPDDFPLDQVPGTDTAELVWRWTMLFDGKYPIEDFDTDSDSDEDSNSLGAAKRHKTTDN